MDFNEIYHLLFETYAGIGILVGAGIVISLLVCVLLEIKTRKVYRNHEVDPEQDEWAIFEDEVAEAEEEEEAKIAAADGAAKTVGGSDKAPAAKKKEA